jgi:autotransporter-associated beta strand protein
MAIIVALSMMIVSSQAANRWWDGTNTGGTGDGASDGGTATWDTATLNWDQGNGSDRVSWTNANNDTAIFAGTAGTVSLGTGITIGGLQFDTASYIITNNILTWGAAGSIVANQDATIGSIMAGSVAVTKSGAGALTLSGRSTYTGGTTVNEGTVTLGVGGGSGSVRGTLNINSNATVNLTIGDALGVTAGVQASPVNIVTGTMNNAVSGNQGYTTDFYLTGGRMTSTGGGTFHFNARSLNSLASSTQSVVSAGITIRGSPLTISNAVGTTSDDVDMRITGIIGQIGTHSVFKTGPGRLMFTAVNSYSGGTTVDAGTLVLGAGGNVGAIRGALTVNAGATVASAASNSTGIATAVNPMNINGGTVDLSSDQHHVWGTTVNMVGGTLKFSSNTGNEHFNVVYNISNSTSQAQILAEPGGAMRMRDSTNAPCITFNVEDGSQDIDLLVDARITVGTGVGGLTKNGAGTVEFTKANTYLGPTVINGGTLIMNGSHSGGGISYTVTAAGVLSGTGTISSAVTVDGVIAPGSGGIGKLTVGSVKWAAGPAWPFELGAASSSDRLAINGGFTNNGGTGFTFDLQNTGVAGVYTLVTWTASTTFTNTDFSANNVPVGLTPAFTMNANSLMLELTSSGGGGITAEATNTTIAVVGGQVEFGFNIASGALYHVQASTNLLAPVDNGFTNITGQFTNHQSGTIIYTNTTSDLLRMFRITSP